MRNWEDLQTKLQELVGEETKVYFQPPPKHKMEYPCIRYNLEDIDIYHASDNPYALKSKYKIMYITNTPDCQDVLRKLAMLQSSNFITRYVTDNLIHYVYEIYY